MYKRTCEVCNVEFDHQSPNTLTCSNECRNARYLNITGRLGYQNDLSSGTVGAISELVVCTDLMKSGYSVFRALSPSCKTDLVAYKDGTMFTVEVRTGYKHVSGTVHYSRRRDDCADIYAVYVTRDNAVHYFQSDRSTPFLPHAFGGKTEQDVD